MKGRPSKECSEDIVRELNLPIGVDEFLKYYTQQCEILFSQPVPLMPGASRLVEHLHRKGIPIAIATSSKKSNFDLKERFHKSFFGLFNHILISPEEPEIVRGKPDPAVFLVCSKRFHVPPESTRNVLVFEDSVSGVKAAIAANMNCAWVSDIAVNNRNAFDDCRPTITISSLNNFVPETFHLPPYDE